MFSPNHGFNSLSRDRWSLVYQQGQKIHNCLFPEEHVVVFHNQVFKDGNELCVLDLQPLLFLFVLFVISGDSLIDLLLLHRVVFYHRLLQLLLQILYLLKVGVLVEVFHLKEVLSQRVLVGRHLLHCLV